jgi:hypothetical protein
MIRPRYIAAACSLLLAPAAFVGVFTLMLVLGTPPSCQDGPCAWDEELTARRRWSPRNGSSLG